MCASGGATSLHGTSVGDRKPVSSGSTVPCVRGGGGLEAVCHGRSLPPRVPRSPFERATSALAGLGRAWAGFPGEQAPSWLNWQFFCFVLNLSLCLPAEESSDGTVPQGHWVSKPDAHKNYLGGFKNLQCLDPTASNCG